MLLSAPEFTCSIHVRINIKLNNVICCCSLNPNTLPDAAAGPVKYMRLAKCLLSDWDNIVPAIGRIMHKNKPLKQVSRHLNLEARKYTQLIRSVEGNIICCIEFETKVSSSIKPNVVAIHIHRRLIIHSSKVEQYLSSSPR
jgi:hypothetical protein